MNRELVEKVVNAVLYEGYILYPYRASSKKNRERFTFGRVYPEDYSIAQNGAEPFTMQTECLVRDESKDALISVSVRFLHPMARDVGLMPAPITEVPEVEPKFEIVPDLQVGEQLSDLAEAVEQKVELAPFPLSGATKVSHEFNFPSSARSSRFEATTEKYQTSSCAGRMRSAASSKSRPSRSTTAFSK
jgi:hydrogenase maturation protease